MWLANESLVTQLQARVRGYLFRKRHAERLAYLHQQEAHVITLQVSHNTVGVNERPSCETRSNLRVHVMLYNILIQTAIYYDLILLFLNTFPPILRLLGKATNREKCTETGWTCSRKMLLPL